MEFINSIFSLQGGVAIAILLVISFVLVLYSRKKGQGHSMSTKDVVAIGIGAALYGVISMISIPVGPNTNLRIAVVVLVIFGALFGPMVGFWVGFIGHALNDALMSGSVWWSWVFLSAVIGLFSGLIRLEPSCNIKIGKINKGHIIKMYIYGVIGILAGSLVAYIGDVFLYGEAADKVWIQIILASISNYAVIAVLGIPSVIALAKRNNKSGLEKE